MQKVTFVALSLVYVLIASGLAPIAPAIADSEPANAKKTTQDQPGNTGTISSDSSQEKTINQNSNSALINMPSNQSGQVTSEASQSQTDPVTYKYNFAKALRTLLNESNSEVQLQIKNLQEKGIAIPDEANSTYSEGLTEYDASLKALDTGDFPTAKIHAFKAMPLFRNATQILIQEEENHSPENILANTINEIADEIANTSSYAEKLRALATSNNVTVSFADFDRVINASNTALAAGNLTEAKQQLTKAQGLLDTIHNQIQAEADSKKGERAKEFVAKTIAAIDEAIAHAKKLGLPQSIIDQLQNNKENLQNATNIDDILSGFDQFSYLQKTIDAYNNERIQNFDKESISIQETLNALQANATKIGIHLDVSSVNDLLVDIKQKIADGQTLEALDELDQVDYQINDLKDLVDGSLSVLQDIGHTRDLITTLEADVHEQNDIEVINQIPIAILLLDYAHTLITNGTSTSFYLDTATEAVDHAKSILNDVSNSVDDVKARHDSILDQIGQLTDQANTLKDTAAQQNDTNALSEINTSLQLLSQAKDLASHWNLSDAENNVSDAQQRLDKISHLFDLAGTLSQANDLKDTATQQNNTNALDEINTSLKLIAEAKDFVAQLNYSGAEDRASEAQTHLDIANQWIDLFNSIGQAMSQLSNLNETATQKNNTEALSEVKASEELILQAKALASKGDLAGTQAKLTEVEGHIDKANSFIGFASLNELGKRADELAIRADVLLKNATDQKNNAALALIHNAIESIDGSKYLLVNGTYDQALEKISSASDMLDSAEGLINEVDQILGQVTDLTNQANALESSAKDQNNTKALTEITQAKLLINHAGKIAPGGQTEQARADLEQAQIHLDNANSTLNRNITIQAEPGSNGVNGTSSETRQQNGTK